MKNLIYLLALVVCIISCNKKEKKPTIYISEELRKYYNYQPGTYWVYYDSVSGVEDSFWVTKNDCCIMQPDVNKDYIVHTIEIVNDKIFDTANNRYVAIAGIGLKDNIISYGFNFPVPINTSSPAFILNTPFKSNTLPIIIGNNQFNDIIVLDNFNYPELKDSLFVNRDVGMVKIKTNISNKNYNLLRWKIVTN